MNKVDEAHEVDDGMYFSSKVSTKVGILADGDMLDEVDGVTKGWTR